MIGRNRMGDRIGEFSRAVGVIFPTEHLVDDVHVAEEIGDAAMLRLALDVVEKDRATAVQLFLDAGDFQIGVDLFLGDDDVAFFFHPLDRTAQISYFFRRRAVSFCSFCHCFPPNRFTLLFAICYSRGNKSNPIINLDNS